MPAASAYATVQAEEPLCKCGESLYDGPPDQERCDPNAAVKPSELVSQPTVEGPIGDVGIRTGEPYATTMAPLPEGWVEEEFFFSGTARTPSGGGASAYKQRILVRRPTDPGDFNGTVVFNWNNVTIPHDGNYTGWESLYDTAIERGFAFVSVSAQYLGTEVSPLGLKQYDPVRYGDLEHPGSPGTQFVGDEYSYDIFSQAAEAAISPKVMGDLLPCVQRRLAMGISGSSDKLMNYIDLEHEGALVFDGFQPQHNINSCRGNAPVPVLQIQSQGGDCGHGGLFRVWELPGHAYATTHQHTTYDAAMHTYSQSNGLAGEWDPEEAGAWGYQAPAHGACLPDAYHPFSYAWGAALVALDDWVRTGVAPEPQPRLMRDAESNLIYDEHGNAKGGVRSPIVDVPIATYYVAGGIHPALESDASEPCGWIGQRHIGGANQPDHIVLWGSTQLFDACKLHALYPTPGAYLEKFDVAVEEALAAGTLLAEGAEDMRRRAVDAAAFVAEAACPQGGSR
jgi:hypothetical protein